MPRRPASLLPAAARVLQARWHRRWGPAALGALALASPLIMAAAPAAAQGIRFASVSGDGSGDLTITVSSPSQLTDWTLSLSNGSGSYPIDDFTDFTDQGAFTANQPQTYMLNAADAASVFGAAGIGLPPGSYTVTATAATDSNGDTLGAQQVMQGAFSFLAQPVLALSSSTFETTEPDQPVSVGGQLTGCATLSCPASWAGALVAVTDVTAASTPQWTTTDTGSSGDFSVAGVTGIPGHSYSASMPAVPGVSLAATAPSATQDVPQYAETSITARAAPAPYGKQSLTGQLTYQSELTQNPAPPGVPVTATSGSHEVSTTTGADGQFRLALPAIAGTTNWQLTTRNNLTTTPFLAGTMYSVPATQLWPVKITGFTASLNRFGQVTVAGCLSAAIKAAPQPEFAQIQIQWRSRRAGRWRELGTVNATRGTDCAGASVYGYGSAPATSAYYRAYFPGDSVYAAAVSVRTERVWIYRTRFRSFRAVPRPVNAGSKITISGTLQYRGRRWRGLRRQLVWILLSYNRTQWFFIAQLRPRTNRRGAFSMSFPDFYGSAYWSAAFQGSRRYFEVSAPVRWVRVRGGASALRPSPVRLPARIRPVNWPSAPRPDAIGGAWRFVLPAQR